MEKISTNLKIIILASLLPCSAFCQGQLVSQGKIACACKDVIHNTIDVKGFSDGKSIDFWVNNQLLPLFNEFAKEKKIPLFPVNKVNIFGVGCIDENTIAMAKKCEKEKVIFGDNPYIILYNEESLKKIDTNAGLNVLFVMAHELGHLVSEHFHNSIPVDPDYNKYAKEKIKDFVPIKKNKNDEEQVMTVKDKLIQELTADAFAVWFLRRYFENHRENKNFDPDKLKNIFPEIAHKLPEICSGSTFYPSCKMRSEFLEILLNYNNWQRIKEFKNPKESLKGFVSQYIDTTIAILTQEQLKTMGLVIQRAREKLKGDTLFRKGTESEAKGDYEEAQKNFLLARNVYSKLVFPEDSIEANKQLMKVTEIISVQSFTQVSILGGSNFTSPQLVSNGQAVNATNAVLGHIGLRLGRYSYVKPLGIEIDAFYDTQMWQFDTYNSDQKALERFKIAAITIQPKFNYRVLNFKKKDRTQGLVLSVGGSWMYPIKFSYQNFQLINQNLDLSLKPTMGYTIGLGFENIKRKTTGNLWGHWRVAIVGTYQPLKFESPQLSNTNFTANAWQIGLNVSVGLSPRFLIKRKY